MHHGLRHKAQRGISSHIYNISTSSVLPNEFKVIFQNKAYKIEQALRWYQANCSVIVSEYRSELRDIRDATRELFGDEMKAAYTAAQDVTGVLHSSLLGQILLIPGKVKGKHGDKWTL